MTQSRNANRLRLQCMNFIRRGFLGPASDNQYTLRIYCSTIG